MKQKLWQSNLIAYNIVRIPVLNCSDKEGKLYYTNFCEFPN